MQDRHGFDDLSRYEWVHELIDARPGIRAVALARHRSLMGEARTGARSGTLVDLVSTFTKLRYDVGARDPRGYQRLAGYGVLFLRWELLFPAEWREGWPYSPWTGKEGVLETFCAGGPTPQTGPALADLLIAAVSREQRCQDRWYWRLARRIDTPQLRARLETTAEGAGERTRLRAQFVLWVIDHPGEGTGSAAWRRWLRSEGRPVMLPVAALGLADMNPAAAALMLADLAPADLARVLEGLHAGPAARMLQQMHPVELAARAVELMDARMAARALKAMDRPTAAGVLAAMDPPAAAARFPGPSRAQLLVLMEADAAVARLRAMTPTAAGERLDHLPPAKAGALLMRLDPAFAVGALAAMGWWGPFRTLSQMPPEVATTLITQLRSDPVARERRDLDFELRG
jgi:hypothetical protein